MHAAAAAFASNSYLVLHSSFNNSVHTWEDVSIPSVWPSLLLPSPLQLPSQPRS